MNELKQIEFDLKDMELMNPGSTNPQKRELRVEIAHINMEYGSSIDQLIFALQEAKEKCIKNNFFKDKVIINIYDRGDNQDGIDLAIIAKRTEFDEEYQERLKHIEKAKLNKREYDLKKFYELKKELGL